MRAATLFRDALGSARVLPARRYVIATGVLLAVLVLAAALFSGSPELTLWTAGGILGSLILLSGAALLIRAAARSSARAARGRPALRWALGSIGGPRESASAVVLSLGLGLADILGARLAKTLRFASKNNITHDICSKKLYF